MQAVLDALPDPAFILSKSGKYVALFGGKDSRYYHDGSALVGRLLSEVLNASKTQYFISKIEEALHSKDMIVEEYALKDEDFIALPYENEQETIWYEGRVKSLDFLVEGEPVVLWVATNISKRYQLETQLRFLSNTDELTGLYNRRRLEKDLAVHFANFKRYKSPTSVLMLDLENLKMVNDLHGHPQGDEVIKTLSAVMHHELREMDAAYRYGGDEFVIILPNTNVKQAEIFANRLKSSFIAQMKLCQGADSTTIQCVSASIGVSAFEKSDTNEADALVRADTLLYQAKNAGKDAVRLG